ncbi:hypothetical protein ACLQ2Q_03510 [Microbacterium sp. DT81.1]|uniref:hypothetical protein n=1 Tax=Microbacterium sp. DT81.1 TaxID=3393413 RepID=UPI003CF9E3DE
MPGPRAKRRGRTAGSPSPERTPHVATLVVGDAVTKLDALAIVALTLDAAVENAGTARPFIRLSPSAWAEIEIPKFGEPPPLAIDVYSSSGLADARAQALALAAVLASSTAWAVTPRFDV